MNTAALRRNCDHVYKTVVTPNDQTTHAYRWFGRDATNQTKNGLIYATDQLSARVLLYDQGISVLRIRRTYQWGLFKPRVSRQMLIYFMYQLSVVARCGIAMSPALMVISQALPHRGLSVVIESIRHQLENGVSLSRALERHPDIFDGTVRTLIRAGEHSGDFTRMLERAAQYLNAGESMRRQIRQILFYPLLLGALAGLMLMFLMMHLIPTFARSFETFNAELPWLTRVVIGIAEHFAYWGPALLMGAIGLLMLLYYGRHTGVLRYLLAIMCKHVPILAPLLLEIRMARFCGVAADTLTAKINLVDALHLATEASGDYLLMRSVATNNTLEEGSTLHAWMRDNGCFPPLLVHMTHIGENAGQLSEILRFLSAHYEKQLEYRMKRLGALLEPVIIVVLGALIGGLILAMYLPIFELGNIF